MTRLSQSFHLSEFLVSQTAARRGIPNWPGDAEIANLEKLCVHVLQPVRDHFGRPVVISSGYRSPQLNRAIGGSATSQHCRGEAADFEIPGLANIDVCRWIRDTLAFDQLILEFYTPGRPNSGWVHVSYRTGRLRGESLTARRTARGTQYLPGLVA